ncbi:unnamed protein product [Oikopleura dioica]|uniref:SCP domain-containing protein n=1 Tax=Oikopleura dioica TaxID=34765 RepID=E4XWQ7_OIKDI|nr:unnamed protein product [Oikopleura dioica]
MPCTVQRFCNYWSEWNDWSDCSVECGGGKRNRRRPCFNGTPGLQGCPGSQFDEEVCNTWRCHSQQNKYKPINEYGMPLTGNGLLLNPFNQECLDYHNFFRAIHRLPELAWNTRLAESATNWAEELVKRAKLGPNMKKIPKKTKNWPHSEQNSPWRDINIGENIAWDLTENGSPCSESVYRWYAEIFYFNPKNPTKGRRGKDPVGHLTALLWPDTTEMGCGTVELLIPQPPNTVPLVLKSTYTVCHYTPQGNHVKTMKKNWKFRDPNYCSTYSNFKGTNQCENAQYSNCQGLSINSKCGCEEISKQKKFTRRIVDALRSQLGNTIENPICTGPCLIYCENRYGTRNYWPNECVGKSSCRCGRSGAICD